jgi:ribosome recycling factor
MTVVDSHLLERVARERRFDPRTLEIARRLFIKKESVKRLSTEYGVIHQRIYAIRRSVIEQVEKYELPEGWTEVTLRGPADLVQSITELFQQRMTELAAEADK